MLASLHIYPLKGGRAVDLDRAAVEPWGLAGDRRWLLVDADCQFMSQRKHPALARVVITDGPARTSRSPPMATRRCWSRPRMSRPSCSR